ncbi:MAG: T9SS type A sorting domain-containing protein [Saprospiraceae bacterium]
MAAVAMHELSDSECNMYHSESSSTTSYTVTVTNDKGCVSTTSVTVIVNPLPNGSISGDTEICIGENTTLTAIGGSSYAWSTGDSGASITVSPSSTTSYTATVTSDKGCVSTTSVTVIVNPLPSGSISGDTEICVGASTTLTASGGSNYAWSTGQTGGSITVSPSSTTSYTVTVTSDKGCVSTTNVTVIVNQLPIPIISGNTKICEGSSTTLTASGGTTYLWSTGSTTPEITVSPTYTTDYSVTVTSLTGCSASTLVTVMVKDKPTLVFTGPDNICLGDSTFIVATGDTDNICDDKCEIANPDLLVYWDLEDCVSNMNNGTHLDYSEFVPLVNKSNCVNVSAGNVHRYNYLKHSCAPGVEDGIGMCIGTQKTCSPSKVNYEEALRFVVTIDPSKSGQITGLQFAEQSPEKYTFVNGPSDQNNFAQKFLIRVSRNGTIIYYKDNISTGRIWNNVTFDFSDNPNFIGVGKGTYLFELVPYCVFDNGGKESIWDIDEIKVFGGCCEGIQPEVSYVWSDGTRGPSVSVNPIENSSYTVTITDCCGCTNVYTKEINVSDLRADLGADRMIALGQTVTLTPVITGQSTCSDSDINANKVSYLWSNGATTPSISVTPTSSTFYRVTVTDCNECTDTESLSIHVMSVRPITIYPNPAKDRLNIMSREAIKDNEFNILLYTVDGRTITIPSSNIQKLNDFQLIVDLPKQVLEGIYLLDVEVSGVRNVEKLIILPKE